MSENLEAGGLRRFGYAVRWAILGSSCVIGLALLVCCNSSPIWYHLPLSNSLLSYGVLRPSDRIYEVSHVICINIINYVGPYCGLVRSTLADMSPYANLYITYYCSVIRTMASNVDAVRCTEYYIYC